MKTFLVLGFFVLANSFIGFSISNLIRTKLVGRELKRIQAKVDDIKEGDPNAGVKLEICKAELDAIHPFNYLFYPEKQWKKQSKIGPQTSEGKTESYF